MHSCKKVAGLRYNLRELSGFEIHPTSAVLWVGCIRCEHVLQWNRMASLLTLLCGNRDGRTTGNVDEEIAMLQEMKHIRPALLAAKLWPSNGSCIYIDIRLQASSCIFEQDVRKLLRKLSHFFKLHGNGFRVSERPQSNLISFTKQKRSSTDVASVVNFR